MHPASLTDDALLAECDFEFLRRGGPGGQHRNKTETAVGLLHRATGIRAEANERRSQADNRWAALRRLRFALAMGVRTRPLELSSLTERWGHRVVQRRIVLSVDHVDYPMMLADVLDHLDACDFLFDTVATGMGTTPSQLVRMLKEYPAALAHVNKARQERGLRPFH